LAAVLFTFLFYLNPEIIVQEGESVFIVLVSNSVLLAVVTFTPLMGGDYHNHHHPPRIRPW